MKKADYVLNVPIFNRQFKITEIENLVMKKSSKQTFTYGIVTFLQLKKLEQSIYLFEVSFNNFCKTV